MKRLLIALFILTLSSSVWAADTALTIGEPKTQGIRQMYVTGSSAIASSLSIPAQGTQIFELISIELHLSAAGAAADLTATIDSGLGAAYDVVLLTQDMTSVVDLIVLYDEEEVIFSNLDQIDFAWANGSSRTYGLVVKYKMK